ncbi:hypothetical protein TNCV_2053401 [Trichonephila clavipes]|nr:hypothetical protein TNCV_2053401 [Trichonephila clavipes]
MPRPTLFRLARIWSYAIFKSRRFYFFVFFPITETQAESVSKPDEIGNMIEEVVNPARHINLEVDSDDAQEMLDSNNQELTI